MEDMNTRTASAASSDLEKAREFFRNDVYATGTTGITIEETRPGHSVVSLQTDDRHTNAAGVVMGAVYTTMADFAFAVAANYDLAVLRKAPGECATTVTLSSSTSFLHSARGGRLTAEADCISDGGHTCVYEITVREETGREMARMTLQGYKIYH